MDQKRGEYIKYKIIILRRSDAVVTVGKNWNRQKK